MPQATTPGNIDTTASGNKLTVTWTGPITGGNDHFSIQFADHNDLATIVSAPGMPAGGFTSYPDAANHYSVALDYKTQDEAKNVADNYQAQVQAMAVQEGDDSAWGKQLFWDIGFSVTVTIGKTSITLHELPGGRYALPVTKDHPLRVSYSDLCSFVESLPGALAMPQSWPNGHEITGSLLITAFVIDTINKTFEFDFSVELTWTIFTGLTVDTIGLDIRRTNGIEQLAA